MSAWGGAVEQADAADEPHGSWKESKVAYLHLKSGSQLIRGVGRTSRSIVVHEETESPAGRREQDQVR